MHYATVHAYAAAVHKDDAKRLSDPAGWLRDLEEARKDANCAEATATAGRWCDD